MNLTCVLSAALMVASGIVSVMLSGAAHAATISEIVFMGQGVVTISTPGTIDGVTISPDVGTMVDINGKAFFGSGVASTAATGLFVCCSDQSISKIEISLSGLGPFASTDEYNGSRVELRSGSVFQFFLDSPYKGNGPGGYISDSTFAYSSDTSPVCNSDGNCVTMTFVLGTWTVENIDVLTYAVPEPAQWTLMLIGFGLLGGQLRQRRALADQEASSMRAP